MSFHLPIVSEHSGWGPTPLTSTSTAAYSPVPAAAAQFASLPFQPFNKNERVWRVSDWTTHKSDDRFNRPASSKDGSVLTQGILGEDGVVYEDDGAGFSLVDNRPKLKPRYGRPFRGGKMLQNNRTGARQTRTNNNNGRINNNRNQMQRGKNQKNQRRMKLQDPTAKEPSVYLDEEWKNVMDLDLAQLGTFLADVEDGEDLEFCGSLESLNPAFNRITPRASMNLTRFENRQHFTASTSEDPVMSELASQNKGNVYATDAILSCLMASPRSNASWDILFRKEANNIIFDKRPLSRIDYISVSDAGLEPQEKDSVNHPDNLSMEATYIGHNFSQQILSQQQPPHNFQRANPFLSALNKNNESASVAFRYRRWTLPNGITLVARCSLNGFSDHSTGQKYVMTRALNEFDPKLVGAVDWRQKLESQTGAVLAAEMKNNHYKLSRWVGEATLSGVDEIKLGFVSRANPKNPHKHVILMTKTFSPQTFADSLNVKTRALWGTLTQLISQLQKLPQGNYIILRDPNKATLHVHSVPANAFDHELDDDEEGEFQEQ